MKIYLQKSYPDLFFSVLLTIREACANWLNGNVPSDDPCLKGKKDPPEGYKIEVPKKSVAPSSTQVYTKVGDLAGAFIHVFIHSFPLKPSKARGYAKQYFKHLWDHFWFQVLWAKWEKIAFLSKRFAGQSACRCNDSLFYPVFGTIWLRILDDPPWIIATAMILRSIVQPALPACPKIPDPGETCGLNVQLHNNAPLRLGSWSSPNAAVSGRGFKGSDPLKPQSGGSHFWPNRR